MDAIVPTLIVFLAVAGVAYVLLSLWAGRKAQEFRARIRKYTGPW